MEELIYLGTWVASIFITKRLKLYLDPIILDRYSDGLIVGTLLGIMLSLIGFGVIGWW